MTLAFLLSKRLNYRHLISAVLVLTAVLVPISAAALYLTGEGLVTGRLLLRSTRMPESRTGHSG